jgi:hypothetical protein
LRVQSKDDIFPSRTLNWECPACKGVTIFTKDINFIDAFRGKIKSKGNGKKKRKKRSRRDTVVFLIACVAVAIFLLVGQFL